MADEKNPELDKFSNLIKKNMEEDIQGKIEESGAHVLNKLCNGDLDFFVDEESEEILDFIYFLCHQYLRTKKMQDSMLCSLNYLGDRGLSLQAMMPVMRHISATNVGFSLYAERKEYHLSLLEAPIGKTFLTCDQPVINKDAYDENNSFSEIDDVQKFNLYYPVSPSRAVLLSRDESISGLVTKELVDSYNRLVLAASHEFVFAASEHDLKSI